MMLQAEGAEPPSGLRLVLPDAAELLWVVVLVAMAAGVVALIVLIVKSTKSPQRTQGHATQLNELAQRVRALEDQAQRQNVEQRR